MSADDEIRAAFLGASTASVASVLQDFGVGRAFMHDVRPLPGLRPRLVGTAFTMRSIAAREDLIAADRALPPERNLQRRAAEECEPGQVLVIDCRSDANGASGGFILFERMRLRGCAGVVSDGGVRDCHDIAESGFPVYAKAPCPPNSRVAHQFVDLNVPISCGGVGVMPGDYIVADPDGVMVVPRSMAAQVAVAVTMLERKERFIIQKIRDGHPIFGTYPLEGALLEQYEKQGH